MLYFVNVFNSVMAATFNGGFVHPFRFVHHSSVSKETHFPLSFILLTLIHPSPSSLSAHPEETDTRRKTSAWKFRVDLTDRLSSGQVWRVLPPSSLSPLLTNHANHAWAKGRTHGRYQHTHALCHTHQRRSVNPGSPGGRTSIFFRKTILCESVKDSDYYRLTHT